MPTQARGGGGGGIAPNHLKPRHEKGMGQQVLQGDKIKDGKTYETGSTRGKGHKRINNFQWKT
jgi:hypothetical protein